MSQSKRDIVNSLLILAVCGLGLYKAFQIPAPPVGNTGAGFFPKVVFVIVIVLGLILLMQSMIKLKMDQGSNRKEKQPSAGGWFRENRKIVITFVTFTVFVFLLQMFGYFIASILFLVGMYLVLRKNKTAIWKPVLGFIVLTAVIYFVFQNVLSVFLPVGIFS